MRATKIKFYPTDYPTYFITMRNGEVHQLQADDNALARIDEDGQVHLSTMWSYNNNTKHNVSELIGLSLEQIEWQIKNGAFLIDLDLKGEVIGLASVPDTTH